MQLTKSQILELYTFTQKHYVDYYDVQTELVDHLANDIESIWKETPNLSFEHARDKAFKKFGIFGFMGVIEAKERQMTKRYLKFVWQFAKQWFSLPKIATTTCVWAIIFKVLQLPFSENIFISGLLFLFLLELFFMHKNRKKLKRKTQIYLLETIIWRTQNGFLGLILMILFNFINLTEIQLHTLPIIWLLLLSFTATLLGICSYIIYIVIPKKADELLQETYPEYKFVTNL